MNKSFLIKSIPILLIISLFIVACGGEGSSNTKLDRKIKSLLKDDNAISQEEWDGLADLIAANSFSCACDTDQGLKDYILQVAEKRRNNPGEPKINAEIADNSSSNSSSGDIPFKLYMESSASMYPYTNGRSDFKEAIYDLLTRLSSESDEKGLINYIGKVIFPVNESVRDFINKRDPYDVAKKNKAKINTTNTDLNEIIKLIFEKGDKDAVHILVSDCIYSINNQDSRDGLAKVKYATKDIFQEHAKDYSLLALQLNSNYKGKYYPYSGGGVNIETDRPYYMLFIGKSKLINEILTDKKYSNVKDFVSLKGFENYHLFSATQNEAVHYSVLPTTEKMGRFRTDRDYSERSYVHGLKNMEAGSRDDIIQFSIAVDLSGVLVEESYKTNKDNYTIEADNDFLIEEITELDDFSRSDKGYVGSATHLMTVSTDKISQKEQALKIGLRKVLPKWIKDSSTDDDSKMTTDKSIQNKTFGLEYMMEGINEGYHKNGEIHQHLTIKINIKK